MNKQETRFIAKLVPLVLATEGTYVEKTYNPLRRGTPDLYFEGPKNIAWVEAKWQPKPWSEPTDIICARKEWGLQKRWLTRAHNNNKPAFAVVGVGFTKGYIFTYPFTFLNQPLISIQEIADCILEQICQ